jgi:hypothetical protein
VSFGWQEPRFSHRSNERGGYRVGQSTQLHARTRGELKIAAAELLSDPAQPAERRTGGLSARNADPYDGTILRQVRSQHPWAAVRVSHARHRKAAASGIARRRGEEE